jgi:AP-3 complex subunit delta-1
MLGHAVLSPLSFPIIELMSSPRYDIKQIGYLAASQSFTSNTEVILLTNNLIKKVTLSSITNILFGHLRTSLSART